MPGFKLVTSSLAVLSLTMPAVAKAESWLCIGDLATGFAYDRTSRSWRTTNFNTNDSHYLVTQPQPEDALFRNNPYIVKKLGSNERIPFAICKEGFVMETFLRCIGPGGSFAFNVKTLKYSLSTDWGYITPTPGVNDIEYGDTPFIEIGRCSRLQ